MKFARVLAFLLLLAPVALFAADTKSPDAATADFNAWRGDLEKDLKQNWLTLVGLWWLKDGTNRVGGDHKLEVPLPEGKTPALVGTIDFHGGKATFKSQPGVNITSGGKPVQTIALEPDVSGHPTVLDLGDIHMLLIQRGKRYGIRVRDMKSKQLTEFKGTQFYPLSDKYRITATFVPYAKPQPVMVPTVLGTDAQMDSPGMVEFTVNGQKVKLQALTEGTPDLFFIVKDATSGHGTYHAGRFLYSDPPKNGKVLLDFNKAHNPPCAWTPYATCPLPPKQNVLNVPIEAGEKDERHGGK